MAHDIRPTPPWWPYWKHFWYGLALFSWVGFPLLLWWLA